MGEMEFEQRELVKAVNIAVDEMSQKVAIGMPVTWHSSHRSQRALLMHWASALGSGGKAIEG